MLIILVFSIEREVNVIHVNTVRVRNTSSFKRASCFNCWLNVVCCNQVHRHYSFVNTIVRVLECVVASFRFASASIVNRLIYPAHTKGHNKPVIQAISPVTARRLKNLIRVSKLKATVDCSRATPARFASKISYFTTRSVIFSSFAANLLVVYFSTHVNMRESATVVTISISNILHINNVYEGRLF